jgi:hypothetical protein
LPIENQKDLVTRQREMKARMKELRKADPDKWRKQELADARILDANFPKDNAGHRRSADRQYA